MQPAHHWFPVPIRGGGRRGFTLIELIVSLTVISVATTILIKMYMVSTDLGHLAQHRELAATIAEGQVAQLISDPGGFVWDLENADGQGFFRVRRNDQDPRAGRKVDLPDVLLPGDASHQSQTVVYDMFRWAVFGRLPQPTSSHIEIVVNVHWKEDGKAEHIALTSAVPRSNVDPGWAEK